MPYFEILVQHASGAPASGHRVVLGGAWGMSRAASTDRYGKAVVEHSETSPTAYVDGRDVGRVRPGRSVVTLR